MTGMRSGGVARRSTAPQDSQITATAPTCRVTRDQLQHALHTVSEYQTDPFISQVRQTGSKSSMKHDIESPVFKLSPVIENESFSLRKRSHSKGFPLYRDSDSSASSPGVGNRWLIHDSQSPIADLLPRSDPTLPVRTQLGSEPSQLLDISGR